MKFSKFLTEKTKSYTNEAILVLHKIVSMVDNAHVDINDRDIRFAIGPMIKKGSYNDVMVVIRKQPANGRARLAKMNNADKFAIVIDAKELPSRKEIDTFLSKQDVFDSFVDAFAYYLENYHDYSGEYEKYEPELEIENTEKFEDNYNALIAEFNETNVDAFNKAAAELKSKIESTSNIISKHSYNIAIKNLQKEYIGTNESEFLVIIRKLGAFDKFLNIGKDLRQKLESRLKTYFATNVKPLLGSE